MALEWNSLAPTAALPERALARDRFSETRPRARVVCERGLPGGLLALGARFLYYSAATAGAGRSALSATPISIDAALRMDTRFGVITIGLGSIADEVLKFVRLNAPRVEHR